MTKKSEQKRCFLILNRLSPELQNNTAACVPEHQHRTPAAAWKAFKAQQRGASEIGLQRMPVRKYAAVEFERTGTKTELGAEHLRVIRPPVPKRAADHHDAFVPRRRARWG